MTEQIKYTSMGLSLDDVLHDYKIVEDSICDSDTFQKADAGLVLSVLSDAIKYLEEYKQMKSAWEEVLQELEKEIDLYENSKSIMGGNDFDIECDGAMKGLGKAIDIIKQKLAEIEE